MFIYACGFFFQTCANDVSSVLKALEETWETTPTLPPVSMEHARDQMHQNQVSDSANAEGNNRRKLDQYHTC